MLCILLCCAPLHGMKCGNPEILGVRYSVEEKQVVVSLRVRCEERELGMAWYSYHSFMTGQEGAMEELKRWRAKETIRSGYHKGPKLGFSHGGTRAWLQDVERGVVFVGRMLTERPVEILNEDAATKNAAAWE